MLKSWFLLTLWSILFFKQKTAYELRMSDWSSDVCSSDLLGEAFGGRLSPVLGVRERAQRVVRLSGALGGELEAAQTVAGRRETEIGRASCRERVCKYV